MSNSVIILVSNDVHEYPSFSQTKKKKKKELQQKARGHLAVSHGNTLP
jgi:hypothetical protein